MEAVGYYIFYAVNWLITLLPLGVLYLLSDLLYFILYYVIRYRRKVVHLNMKNAFPEKSEKEILAIEKKFYKHLSDVFIETFKLTHMGRKELEKRYTIENTELLDRLYTEGKDVIAVLGHYNNWEWMNTVPLYLKYKCVSVYKPLKNKHFDKFINNSRKRYGMVLTPMSVIIREIINDRKNGVRTISFFLADQTPAKGDINFWTTFLNQDTPVYLGAEKIAMKYDMAVVFFNVQKVKRGYYKLIIELLFEKTEGLKEHQITEAHVKRLDELIRQKPESWVWSHRRWKHKRENANV
jgi:Kdo2-lipid IVA lauroyltransferase/acyltransferase